MPVRPARLPSVRSSRSSRLRALIGLLAIAGAVLPVVAHGQARKGDAPANREYTSACATGNARYATKEYDAAVASYRKAVELAPDKPLAYYLLGEAQVAAGNLGEADAAFNHALEASGNDVSLHAKVLFCLADLKERQRKWEEARTAWQTYLDWADHHPNASAFPTTAQSRMQVLDGVLKQDKQYEVVRQRIAASADGGVFSDPAKSPPPAK
jgi:tetratricopeptide (TPR) repeat protein